MEKTAIDTELKHVRSIHFWLLVTAIVIFYFRLTIDISPYILNDLKNFKYEITRLQNKDKEFVLTENKAKIDSLIKNLYSIINKKLNNALAKLTDEFGNETYIVQKFREAYLNLNPIISDSIKLSYDSSPINKLKIYL